MVGRRCRTPHAGAARSAPKPSKPQASPPPSPTLGTRPFHTKAPKKKAPKKKAAKKAPKKKATKKKVRANGRLPYHAPKPRFDDQAMRSTIHPTTTHPRPPRRRRLPRRRRRRRPRRRRCAAAATACLRLITLSRSTSTHLIPSHCHPPPFLCPSPQSAGRPEEEIGASYPMATRLGSFDGMPSASHPPNLVRKHHPTHHGTHAISSGSSPAACLNSALRSRAALALVSNTPPSGPYPSG